MEMISGFLLAIDRAITLLKERNARRLTLLNEIVEPVFAETEKVASNYNFIFEKLLSAIDKGDEEVIRGAAFQFLLDRMELKAVRIKLDALTRAYLGLPEGTPIDRFDDRLEKIPKERAQLAGFLRMAFRVVMNSRNKSATGLAAMYVRDYITQTVLQKDSISLEGLRRHIELLQEYSQWQWECTCQAYAELKIKLSLPS